jgi:RNA polymerase sigma factor (sigma-70 family)
MLGWFCPALDTGDLVQMSLLAAMHRAESFESAHPGAFFGYLRQILMHALGAAIKKESAHGVKIDIHSLSDEDVYAAQLSTETPAYEQMAGYEQLLQQLQPDARSLVLMRFELGMSFVEIAKELNENADAVRIRLSRILKKMIVESND